jgi:hypothetical protein
MASRSEFLEQHEREAARLRALLATATTPAMKARLIQEIEKHEELLKPDMDAELEPHRSRQPTLVKSMFNASAGPNPKWCYG